MITEQNYYGVDWKSLPEDLTKRLKVRNYPHFDKRVSPQRVWSYISNPKNIASHGFYPFIHFSICFKKFNKNKWIRDKQKKSRWPGVKFKERNICYSAHVDRYIYQYYAFLLNQKYNEKLNFLGIDDVPVAYRTNTTDSNIEFSKRAFEFIISQENCCVMIGDFTNFFDNLNHNFLKRKLCDVLDCKTLSDDWYAVFKNITKYTKWEYDDLYKYNCDKYNSNKINKDDVFSKKKFAALETVLTKDEFKSQIKNKHLKANTVGVPQGSAISAVLANIYMIDVDKAISDYVKSLKGLYMRYSDDFIVVIPGESERFQEHYKFIRNCLEKADSVELSPEKTQIFTFEKSITGNTDKALEYGKIKNVISEFIPDLCNGNDIINFLGFSFDGKTLRIRDKTITKYYYRMKKKARYIVTCEYKTKFDNQISCENLFDLYSIKGAFPEKSSEVKHGNFITYVARSEKIYNSSDGIHLTDSVLKNHLKKIRKQLKNKKGTK